MKSLCEHRLGEQSRMRSERSARAGLGTAPLEFYCKCSGEPLEYFNHWNDRIYVFKGLFLLTGTRVAAEKSNRNLLLQYAEKRKKATLRW